MPAAIREPPSPRRAPRWLLEALALPLTSLLATAVAASATPQLVRDLNAYGSYPAELTVAGEKIFFGGRDLEHGDELWCYAKGRADPLADLAPGADDFIPRDLAALQGRVFFRSGMTGLINRQNELWASDGTAAGTQRVLTLPGAWTRINGMRSDGRMLYLQVMSLESADRNQLWLSDGTAAGTRPLPAKDVDHFNTVPPAFSTGRFYFTCNLAHELWVTDGTDGGTRKLAQNPDPAQGRIVATDGGLVYVTWNELWVTDGTLQGTRQVVDLNGPAGSFPFNLAALGTRLVFFAKDSGSGVEPWITDGTTQGTHLIKDLTAGAASGIAPNLLSLNSDGSAVISVYGTEPSGIGSISNRVLFQNYTERDGWELWSTDGSEGSTGRLVDLQPGSAGSFPSSFYPLGGRAVFVATGGDGARGRELWITDGTTAGTQLLADLAPGAEDSRPDGFTPYQNGLVFRAYDGEGTKLWYTDGTTAGTRQLDGRFRSSHDGRYWGLCASGNTLFFNFSDDDAALVHLAASDGTAAGTRRVFGPIPTALTDGTTAGSAYALYPLGAGEVLWTPWVENLGTELWFSDGTFPGTGLLHDFSGETGVDASTPFGFSRLADDVYFTAYVGLGHREFFRLNVGTLAVASAPLSGGSVEALGGAAQPEVAGGRVFVNSNFGRRPPVSWHVYLNRPGEPSMDLLGIDAGGLYPHATHFTDFHGFTYFSVDRDGATELWRTDGTATGNTRSAILPQGKPIAVVNERMLVLQQTTVFSIDGATQAPQSLFTTESPVLIASDQARAFIIDRRYAGESPLWVTDGTATGTHRVFGFERWALNETNHGVLVDNVLFFCPNSAAYGHELWRSDGTTPGTRLVADLWPGPGDGASQEIAATSNGRVYYVGRHPLYGNELFAVPGEALGGVRQPAIVGGSSGQTGAIGQSVTLAAAVPDGPPPGALQWQRNGDNIASATNLTLALTNVQSVDTGLYQVQATYPAGTSASPASIVAVTSTSKVTGDGEELLPANVLHPNGNVFDQVLLKGVAETITADWTEHQTTRTSFIDLDGDIVQVEFSGPGSLSLVLANASGPALPEKYNQDVAYMRGHAGIVITGATEQTNISVFTVGRATAFDPTGRFDPARAISETNDPARNGNSLFQGHDSTSYGGIAEIAFLAIASTNGKFGGVRTANVHYFAGKGLTGVYAPGVAFSGPLYLGDVTAFDAASPVIITGAVLDARITGGDLLQMNGAPVQISGLAQLKFTMGTDSHGHLSPAAANRALLEQEGRDVTAQVVVNP